MNATKDGVEQVEEAYPPSSRKTSISKTKGDRALALIGDERISLTDEDVSQNLRWLPSNLLMLFLLPEQEYTKEDR